MSLITLPAELRSMIYDFVFPAPQTPVQIVPFQAALPACRLNLPTYLYLVCKLIYNELEPLSDRLRRLDLTYIIRGAILLPGWRVEYGPRKDDDYSHFAHVMGFAERVRLVGSGPIMTSGRSLGSPSRTLKPGPHCALKVLEIQPRMFSLSAIITILLRYMGLLTTHPDVAERLEVRLIRDMDDLLESDEDVKKRLRVRQKKQGSSSSPIYANLAERDKPPQGAHTQSLNQMEAWLNKFQNLSGEAIQQRAQIDGPLRFGAVS